MNAKDAIVVAIDSSGASQAAVRWAANTAEKRRKPLHLAAFWDVPTLIAGAYEAMVTRAVQGEAREALAAAHKLAAEVAPGLTVTQTAEEGAPARKLLALSQEAIMIVMGARGLGRVTGAVLGSVSAAVVSHAACPVVIVREDMPLDGAGRDGPVVVGIDGSDISRQAAEVAYQEADARGVAVVAVSSWLDGKMYASPAALEAARKTAEALQREQAAMLDKYMRGLAQRYPDMELQQVVSQGQPAEALARAAESAQLLVVGSHGRGGFLATVLGSTSRALLQKSPCPIMVVRPKI